MNMGSQTKRDKVRVTMVICEAEERLNRSGVNALQIDPESDRLFTAGRDSVIRVFEHERYCYGMEDHTDWVNDIVLCRGGRILISASSDTTIKVWNAHTGNCMSTLQNHRDYVKALAYAKYKEQLASGGLDKDIILWDINTLKALTSIKNPATAYRIFGYESVYSLAMNPSGNIIGSGSTEKVLRFWDPRVYKKLFKLKGHSDNVKALVLSRDATLCVSGSSDGTIKIWSLNRQRCIQTLRVHSGPVWTLLVTENWTHIISGGRDKKVIMTEILSPQNSIIVCTEQAPILNLCFTTGQKAVWVSTSDSNINCWKLPTEKHFKEDIPMPDGPVSHIPGGAAIQQAFVLNDKRHILTQDSHESVALYDVLQAKRVEDIGQVDFEEEIKERFKMIYIPDWFKVDLKTGMLTIHLGQDQVDCFSAWVSARDAGIKDCPEPDSKINYGKLLLQALLEHWKGFLPETDRKIHFSVPEHIPLFISEIGGRTLYRVAVGEAGGDTENAYLNETVPSWVTSFVKDDFNEKYNKIQFYLKPHNSVPIHLLKQDRLKKSERLIAKDFIQCREVAEHILGKLSVDDNASPPLIELSCNEQVLDPYMDMRTVKHFIWKRSSDLILSYKILSE